MLGNTTPGAMRLREALEEGGQATVVFHANGVGGSAMEKLAASGYLSASSTSRSPRYRILTWTAFWRPGPIVYASPDAVGLPQIVVPGGIDFFNQPAPLSAQWIGRQTYHHNPISILVRLLPDEMAAVARMSRSG